jgi:Domain of Unknown Function (DUF748)
MKRAQTFLRGFYKYSRRILYVLGGLLVVLILIRLSLPFAIKHYVNHQLNKSKDYGGSVGDIHVALWRGAYQIKNIDIKKKNGQVREPFFSAPLLDLSIEWAALFHHRIVGKIYMQQPKMNFVKGPDKEKSQTGEDTPWNEMLETLFPFKLNRLDINEGEIHYKDDYAQPKVDIYFSQLGATATNLSNAKHQKQHLPAGIVANAKTIGQGTMDFHLQFNPVAPAPEYQLQASLTNVDLRALNDFLRAYGKFDVEKGEFAMFTSVAATNKAYDGYIKVFFNHLDVFAWKKEREKNILKIFWEAIVGTVATVLKNQDKDQLATKVPISGVYTNSTVDIVSTIGELLQNAFVRALLPKYDKEVTTGEVAKKVKKGEIPNANKNGEPTTNNPYAQNAGQTNKGATMLKSKGSSSETNDESSRTNQPAETNRTRALETFPSIVTNMPPAPP